MSKDAKQRRLSQIPRAKIHQIPPGGRTAPVQPGQKILASMAIHILDNGSVITDGPIKNAPLARHMLLEAEKGILGFMFREMFMVEGMPPNEETLASRLKERDASLYRRYRLYKTARRILDRQMAQELGVEEKDVGRKMAEKIDSPLILPPQGLSHRI